MPRSHALQHTTHKTSTAAAVLNTSYVPRAHFSVSKLNSSVHEALKKSGLRDSDKVLVGGFGLCGIPMALIRGIQELGVKDLTIVR